ncbi:MAG: HAMP domain-containing sensor histidine kinase [Arcicella sp.]|nr:HAMP domain-containing sensor histidine kinase [Arcicella sp.]
MLNIRSKLTYEFMALATAILVFFSVGVYFFSSLYLEKRFYKRLRERAITTTTLIFDLNAADTTVIKLVNVSDRQLLTDESIMVYNEQLKKVVFSANPKNSLITIKELLPLIQENPPTIFKRINQYQVIGVKVKNKYAINWVFVSAIDVNGGEALEDLRKILLVMILVGILLLGISGWFFADKALAPMSEIIKQVNQIFPNNIKNRVQHPNRFDEIGLLVATFNQLLDRTEEAFVMQKMFIANVSHELKNPLTKIYSQIEITLMQKRKIEDYEKDFQSLKEDTRTLIQLTNTLLNLANTVVSPDSINKTPVRLDELLWETKNQITKWHKNYEIELNFNDFPDDEAFLLVLGNEASLKVVFMNLMDNACKFSENNTAKISFLASSSHITIQFFNESVIIPETDLPHIFRPFYRSNATAPAIQGHGIGLAIVAQILQLHQAKISVISIKEGITFIVEFPNLKNFNI